MLTGAERNSLALTLGFLLLGSGLKLWRKAEVELGPFPTPRAEAIPGATDAGSGPVSADAPPEAPAADSAAAGIPAPGPGTGPVPADSGAMTDVADESGAAYAVGEADEAGAGAANAAGAPGTTGTERVREAPGMVRRDSPARGPASRRKTPPAGKVDANRATAEVLATVPGIGPRIAAAIVAYRRERGAFRDLAQLREVKGIGEKKWAAIAPCLTVQEERAAAPGEAAETGPGTGPKADGSRGTGGR